MIASLFPTSESLTLEALLARCHANALAEPFADDSIAFCDALSKRMLRMPGPQWTALGFFFREAAVKKMREELAELETRGALAKTRSDYGALAKTRSEYGALAKTRSEYGALAKTRSDYGALRAPRGLVFHVTPGNVDTQFLYSWLFSLLVGNANVVRVSSRLPEAAKEACRSLGDLASDFPRIRASTTIVSYEHDKTITDALSKACDLRVLWGGDASIAALRESPLRADAKEMAFPDRFSFAVVEASRYLAMDDAARTNVARGLQNDIFIFDQMACSSPKMVAWVGTSDDARAARDDLWPRLEKLVEAAGIRVQTMTALDKLHFAHGELADGKVRSVERFSNELFVLRSDDIARLRSASWGGGLVVETVVPDVEAALGLVQHSDQTLAHAGFTKEEVIALARRARTRGLARIVPVGRALAFSRYWDGMDLLSELTRAVSIET